MPSPSSAANSSHSASPVPPSSGDDHASVTCSSSTASRSTTRSARASRVGLGAACSGSGTRGIHANQRSISRRASSGWKSPATTSDAFDAT